MKKFKKTDTEYTLSNHYPDSDIDMPTFYLFLVGGVQMLRQSLNIPDKHKDKHVVLVYGFTNDAKLELEKCKQIFENVEGAYEESIGVVRFSYITESMGLIVETHMKKFFLKSGFHFQNDYCANLIICSHKNLYDSIKTEYTKISAVFGKNMKVQNKLAENMFYETELEKTIKKQKDKISKLKKENKMLKGEIECE